MKRRLWAMILALTFVVGLIPSAAASETVSEAALEFRSMTRSEEEYDSASSDTGGDNSCGSLSFMYYNNDTEIRDMSEFPTEIGETFEMYLFCGDNDLSGGTVTSSAPSVVKFVGPDARPGGQVYIFTIVGVGTTTLTYTKTDGTVCAAEVTISGTSGGGETPGESIPSGSFATVGDYTIGFSMPSFEVFSLSDFIGFPYSALKSDTYIPFHTMEIAAATIETVDDGTVVYTKADSKDISLQIKRTWIKIAEGGVTDILSFSDSDPTTEKTNYSNCMIEAYMKEGYTGEAKVFAEVAVTLKGVVETVTVSCTYWPNVMLDNFYDRPENDTVEALNQFLAQLVESIGSDTRNVYKVVLASQTYEGTIVLPNSLEGQQIGIVGQDNGSTAVKGSINLNGKSLFELDRIAFKESEANCAKTSDGKTTAIFGGGVTNMYSCTFEGYEVAVDSNRELVTVSSGNVFIDNEVAVRMDMTGSSGNQNPWKDNLFIRNGIAVQILGMSDWFPAYYFRILDSDFIGNETDFDVQCGGTFYFHRNYFGRIHQQSEGKTTSELIQILSQADTETKLNQVVSSHPAKVITGSGAKVITNPRWKNPMRSWAQHGMLPLSVEEETPYENFLTSDWTQETQIVDKEAKDLIIDSSAFNIVTENKKVIDVVDEDENAIGTWIFD